MGASLDEPLVGGGQAFINPLAADVTLKEPSSIEKTDIEAAHSAPACSSASASSKHAPSARLAALVVLAHAAAFWCLFLGVRGGGDSAAKAAAALTYEATAGLTSFFLAALWVWSRLAQKDATTTPPLPKKTFSIPALAALFLLQWGAFSYLLLAACCE